MTDDPLGIVDSSRLSDADWAEINKLKLVYERDGQKGLSKAMAELATGDPVRAARVMGALYPDEMREAIKDVMAEMGITEEDIRASLRKLESPARDQ